MKKFSIIYMLVAAGLILMAGCGGGVGTSADGDQNVNQIASTWSVLAAIDKIDTTGFHDISTALNAAAVFADVSTRTQGNVQKALTASQAAAWPADLEVKVLVFETDVQTLIDALAAEDLVGAQAAGDAIHGSQHDLSIDVYAWLETQVGAFSGAEVMAAIDMIDSTGFHDISTALNAATVFADVSTRTQGKVQKALTVSRAIAWPTDLAAKALVFETDAQTLIDALAAEDLVGAQAAGDVIHGSQHGLSTDVYTWLETQMGAFSGANAVTAAIDMIDSTGFHDISTALNAATVFADVSTRTQGNVQKALTVSRTVAWPTAANRATDLMAKALVFETDVQALIDALVAEDLAAAQAAGDAIHGSQHALSNDVYAWLKTPEDAEEQSVTTGSVLAAIDKIDTTGFHDISTALNAAAVFADVSTRTQGNVQKALTASKAAAWPADLEAKLLVFETDAQTLIDALAAEDLAAAQAVGDAIHGSQHDLSNDVYAWLKTQVRAFSDPEVMAAIDMINSTGFHDISTALNTATVFADVSTRTQGKVEKALTVSRAVAWPTDLAAKALVFETDAQTLIDALAAEDLVAAQAAGDVIHGSQHDLSNDVYAWLETQVRAFSGASAVTAAIDMIDSTGFHDISTALNAATVFADVSTRTQGNVQKALTVSQAVAWPTAASRAIDLMAKALVFESDAQALIDALAAEDLAAAQAVGDAIHGSQHGLSNDVYTWLKPQVEATVSFINDVYPVFSNRNCALCHDASHPSLDLGGNAASTYTEVTSTFVDTHTPADSLILTKPLHTGAGGVAHAGGNLFTDTTDMDYQTILTWVTEGALNN